ncbi:MAG: hypothetical protein ABIP48_17900 [Planctomycetota bacterium]
MCEQSIPDDELLFRRIPPGTRWFAPPDRLTSSNFRLREGEEGISVYRARVVSADNVLKKPGVIPGSFLTETTAGAIRRLTDATGEPLHLDVVAVADKSDSGHAEIRGIALRERSKPAADALKTLFKRVTV